MQAVTVNSANLYFQFDQTGKTKFLGEELLGFRLHVFICLSYFRVTIFWLLR